jgi:Cft2 family RNA processing exonuclease
MALQFKSLRSSGSGNCLMLWTDHTTLLLDCGITTQRDCHDLLGKHANRLDGVIVFHAHGDHICYSSLRVMDEINSDRGFLDSTRGAAP